MKDTFEAIWQDKKCRFPSNIVLWNTSRGCMEQEGLYYTKGKRYNFLKGWVDGKARQRKRTDKVS